MIQGCTWSELKYMVKLDYVATVVTNLLDTVGLPLLKKMLLSFEEHVSLPFLSGLGSCHYSGSHITG